MIELTTGYAFRGGDRFEAFIRLYCSLTYIYDPVRRIVTVERTVGKVMLTLRF